MASPLLVSAEQIISPMREGLPTRGKTGACIERVESDLVTTLAWFQSGDQALCLVSGPLETRTLEFRPLLLQGLAERLSIAPSQILLSCDHNHSVPNVTHPQRYDYETRERPAPDPQYLTEVGRDLLGNLFQAAETLREKAQPAWVYFGTAEERRVAYNRKGQWPDGSHYFIREQERLELGEDYTGTIDPAADVVTFESATGDPLLVLTRYTAHPVTAYHPEHMMAFGDWPAMACDRLREAMGLPDLPIAFLQGCAGNVNSRYFLSGDPERSRELGDFLGDSFVRAWKERTEVHPTGFQFRNLPVSIPFASLPSPEALKSEIQEIESFVRDPNQTNQYGAYSCVGLNFPETLSGPYRAKVVQVLLPWYQWALEQQQNRDADTLPTSLEITCPLLAFGNLGILGLPFEPFVETGELLKAVAPYRYFLPCGYVGEIHGYIPNAEGVGDREYMSSFYRYTNHYLPYEKPAGDAIAEVLKEVRID